MIRAYYGQPSNEFLRDLRDAAIKGGMKTAFIDQIDNLLSTEDLEKEVEELGEQVSDLESDRDDLVEEMEGLLKAMRDLDPNDDAKEWKLRMEMAEAAISRATS